MEFPLGSNLLRLRVIRVEWTLPTDLLRNPPTAGTGGLAAEDQSRLESGRRESILLTEPAVEVRPRSEAKESDQLAVDLVYCPKRTGRKIRQFELPKPRVSTDAGHCETGSRAEGLPDEGWQDRFERPTDGLRKGQILLVRGGSENEAMHHGQRPLAASSRERARTSRPATSFPSTLRRSISPY